MFCVIFNQYNIDYDANQFKSQISHKYDWEREIGLIVLRIYGNKYKYVSREKGRVIIREAGERYFAGCRNWGC